GWCCLRRAADEPGSTHHRLLHPAADLRPPQADSRLQVGRMTVALPEISRSMLKNSLVLGLFAIATVGLVAVLQQATAGRIANAEREAQVRALSEILPQGSYDNHLLDNSIQLDDPLLGNKSPQTAYIALKDGQPSAVILRATAPDGYSGAIHLLIGIQADGRLAG